MEQELLRDVSRDLKETRQLLTELLKQSAIHNEILAQHERRSTNLEDRFKPVEETYVFLSKFAGVLVGLCGISSAVLGLYKILK
jgi:hypothetical protein